LFLRDSLEQNYTAKTETGYCLQYEPGEFTRLPNRYYTFQYGGIDFFALDSNTFNEPLPLPTTQEGEKYRKFLENRRAQIEQDVLNMIEASSHLDPDQPDEAEELESLRTKLSQMEEVKADINKQLTRDRSVVVDTEQLDWLKQRLIQSWQSSTVRGRILYFHHPPYVTEVSKWHQAQTLAIRNRLRDVLNAVAEEVGDFAQGRPLVDLVLNGHAHCLEHLQTLDTGHADSNIHWLICGGSGSSLRRQRPEGVELMEPIFDEKKPQEFDIPLREVCVARSNLFIGRNGQGSEKRRPYSGLRIDVKPGNPPKFIARPLIAEWYHRQWHYSEQSFSLYSSKDEG
jgi:hypothetical protein